MTPHVGQVPETASGLEKVLPPLSIARSSIDSFLFKGFGELSCEVEEIIPPSSLIDVIVRFSSELDVDAIVSLIGATGRCAITGDCSAFARSR